MPSTFDFYHFACPEHSVYMGWHHVWFISLRIESSSLQNVETYIGIFPFWRLNNIPQYVYSILYLLIHQACFPLWMTMTIAVMKLCVCRHLFEVCFPCLGCLTSGEIPGSHVNPITLYLHGDFIFYFWACAVALPDSVTFQSHTKDCNIHPPPVCCANPEEL